MPKFSGYNPPYHIPRLKIFLRYSLKNVKFFIFENIWKFGEN